jgi:hypothetical protein
MDFDIFRKTPYEWLEVYMSSDTEKGKASSV